MVAMPFLSKDTRVALPERQRPRRVALQPMAQEIFRAANSTSMERVAQTMLPLTLREACTRLLSIQPERATWVVLRFPLLQDHRRSTSLLERRTAVMCSPKAESSA